MKKSTSIFWKWLAMILIALNFVLLYLLAFRSGRSQVPPFADKEGPAKYLIEKLGFTKEQVAEFNRLKQAHSDTIDVLRRQGKELRNSFFEGLKQDSANPAETEKLGRQIADNQARIELATYRHFEAVRRICTAEQKQVFDSIIQDVLRQMGRPPARENGGKPH